MLWFYHLHHDVRYESRLYLVHLRFLRFWLNHDGVLQLKDKEISENDQHKAEEIIQKVTDSYIKKVDEILADKEKELMDF
jgi:ribosome recycling factor